MRQKLLKMLEIGPESTPWVVALVHEKPASDKI